MANDFALKLRIDALVSGAKDVVALANELKALASAAAGKSGDPTSSIEQGAIEAAQSVRDLGRDLKDMATAAVRGAGAQPTDGIKQGALDAANNVRALASELQEMAAAVARKPAEQTASIEQGALEAASNVRALARDLDALSAAAARRSADPTAGIEQGAVEAGASIQALARDLAALAEAATRRAADPAAGIEQGAIEAAGAVRALASELGALAAGAARTSGDPSVGIEQGAIEASENVRSLIRDLDTLTAAATRSSPTDPAQGIEQGAIDAADRVRALGHALEALATGTSQLGAAAPTAAIEQGAVEASATVRTLSTDLANLAAAPAPRTNDSTAGIEQGAIRASAKVRSLANDLGVLTAAAARKPGDPADALSKGVLAAAKNVRALARDLNAVAAAASRKVPDPTGGMDQRLQKAVANVRGLARELNKLTATNSRPLPDNTKPLRDGAEKTTSVVAKLRGELTKFFAVGAIVQFFRSVNEEIIRTESAFRGLRSVAEFTGVGIEGAYKAATDAAADGLITVADASKALQNLLARGFSLDQAIDTINRLKDAAAFNRQASLSMAEAVVSATEGLKNENSVLVDNAGVTKNVSIMWQEYANKIGVTVAELTQAQKVEAEYQGVMRETEAQLGNSAKAAEGLQGQQAKLSASMREFKAVLGDALTPALIEFANAGKWIVENVLHPWLRGMRIIGAAFAAVGRDIGIMMDAITSRSFAGIGDRFRKNAEQFRATVEKIATETVGTLSFTENVEGKPNPQRRQAFEERLKSNVKPKKEKKEKKEQDTTSAEIANVRALAEAELDAIRSSLELAQAEYDRALARNLISTREYYAARTAIQQRAIDAQMEALQTELAAQSAVARSGSSENERLRAKAEVAKIGGELTQLAQRRGEVERQAAFEVAKIEGELADQLAAVRGELVQLSNATTPATRREAIERELQPLLDRVRAAGDREGEAQIVRLIDLRAAQAELAELERLYAQTIERMQAQEQSIDVQRGAGLITEREARQQIVQLHQDAAAEVEQLIPLMERLAAVTGDPAAITRLQQMRAEIAGLKTPINEAGVELNRAFTDGLSSGLQVAMKDIRDVGDAAMSVVDSVANAISRMVSESLAQNLFQGLFGSNPGQGAGFGGWLANLFQFHRGGVVGRDGDPVRLTAQQFLSALPRFHDGGLARNETLAVLEHGEEVLTRDDPRHRDNAGRAAPSVNMYISTPNAESFRKSSSQLLADARAGLARASRNGR
ncbi:MAG: hypothetical protein IT532_00355 [Burkholderiales bacterium]|nr:hypothetical protein [Burkholderiales bacterium]